jgi:hypothetical protein
LPCTQHHFISTITATITITPVGNGSKEQAAGSVN